MELDEARGHEGEILIHRFLDKPPEEAELVSVGAHALYVRLEGTTEVVSMHPRTFTLRVLPEVPVAASDALVRRPYYVNLGVTDDQVARGEDFSCYDFPNLGSPGRKSAEEREG
jgi:hypothetical protein